MSLSLQTEENREPDTLAVVGIHREEREFGESVSNGLDRNCFSVFRIMHGISARKPRPDQRSHYLNWHKIIYRHVLKRARPYHKLIIDIHYAVDEALSADILCFNRTFLLHLKNNLSKAPLADPQTIRFIQFIGEKEEQQDLAQLFDVDNEIMLARPDIPRNVWAKESPIYVCIEFYLREEGAGNPEDWAFSCTLIESIRQNYLDFINSPDQ